MASERGLSRVAQQAERALGGLAAACHGKPVVTLAAIVAISAAAAFFARTLTVNTDLGELLPKSFRSIQDLDKLTERFGGVGFIVVVGTGGEPDMLRKFADDVKPKLEELEWVRYVDYQRPSKYFEDRALYFLDVEDLEYVRDKLDARMTWEKQQRNPLYLDLEETPAPEMDFDHLKEKYAGTSDSSSDSAWMARQLGEPYYINEEAQMIALLAKPASQAIDLDFSLKMVTEVETMLRTLDLKQYGENFDIQLTGRYQKRVDLQRQISEDLNFVSTLGALLMLLYLVIHFRRFLAVALIIAPLVIGIVWTFGFTSIVFGSLNILTGFVGIIMLGLGIDHGIHLLGRYVAERGSHDEDTAVRNTFAETGRAVAIAALTTTVGFATLGISEFRAFKEFGVVCAAGMVLTVLSYSVTLPALLGLATNLGWKPRVTEHARTSGLATFIQKNSKRIVVAIAAVFVITAFFWPKAAFDYDFASLESNTLPSYVIDKQVNEILGFSYVPVAVLTSSLEEERMISKALRERQREQGKSSVVDIVASSADLLPLNQEAKVPIIREIGGIIKGVKTKWLEDPEYRNGFKILKRAVKANPFGRDDLPMSMQLLFKGVGGKGEEGFVLVFPAADLSDGGRIIEFANTVRGVDLPDGRTVSASGEDLILADILLMIADEAPLVLSLTFAAIILTLILLVGSIRDGMLCLVPPVFTLSVTVGLLWLIELDVNYLNMVMFPVLFGIGVDGGAHVVTRVRAGIPMNEVVTETGRAIAGAILTTGLGFGALLLASHDGLNSFGLLAVTGLSVNLLASLVVLPALMTWWKTRSS